jgi:hypothetical protein
LLSNWLVIEIQAFGIHRNSHLNNQQGAAPDKAKSGAQNLPSLTFLKALDKTEMLLFSANRLLGNLAFHLICLRTG